MEAGLTRSQSRQNRLDRFERSSKRVNTPSWMPEVKTSSDNKGDEEGAATTTTSAEAAAANGTLHTESSSRFRDPESSGVRLRYRDYKQQRAASASSTYRCSAASSSSSQWRPPSRTSVSRTPNSVSREPSPSPYGPKFLVTSSAGAGGAGLRWSTSTLCDSAYSGNNTPTDSCVSGKSMCSNRSTLMQRAGANTKPYIGWRSQDNLVSGRMTTPTERMAYSLRRGSNNMTNSGSARSWTQSSSTPTFFQQQSRPRDERQVAEHQLVHDSIRSVSTAIMEFCKAPDVPLPPPDEDTLKRRHRSKERQQRSRVVWLESSFVSAAAAATGGDNGLNQVH